MADETQQNPPQQPYHPPAPPAPLTPNQGGGYNQPNEEVAKFFGPRETGSIRSLDDIAYAGANMLNQGNVAEGSNQPPMQHGDFRVQFPSGFRVLSTTSSNTGTGTIYTLVWNDVVDSANGLNQARVTLYRIYVQQAFDENVAPTMLGQSVSSPCTVHVIANQAGGLTFTIQPVLSNGLFPPLEDCPTCTAEIGDPLYTFTFPPADFGGAIDIILGPNEFGSGGDTRNGLGLRDQSLSIQTLVKPSGIESSYVGGDIAYNLFLTGVATPGAIFRMHTGSGSGGFGAAELIRLVASGTTGNGQGSIEVFSDSPDTVPQIRLYDGTGGNDVTLRSGTAATANAGIGALPATPEGFIKIKVGGTAFRVPYYPV